VIAPKFVTDKAIEYLIDQGLKKSGVRKLGTVHMSHGLRKYFITQCESSPMKSLHVSMLAGHDTGIKKHYHKPSESIVLEDFVKYAVDALTVSDEHRWKKQVEKLEIGQAQEIDRIKSRYDTLEAKYKQEHIEWGTLKDEVKELRRMLSAIDNEDLKRKTFDKMYQEAGAVVLDQYNNSAAGSTHYLGDEGYNSNTYKKWTRQQ
jgi:hypothetical protein